MKKSWDSLNLVLVLFAIVCGFLSRNTNNNNNGNSSSYVDPNISNASQEVNKSNPLTPHRWYEDADRTVSYNYSTLNRLKSSSSYPDLRQESAWVALDRQRFYDDTHISNYRIPGSDQLHHRLPRREPLEEEESETKTISVDTFVVRTEEVSPNSPPPEPPLATPPSASSPSTPPKVVKRRAKRTSYQALEHQHEKFGTPAENGSKVVSYFHKPPPSAPPPVLQQAEQKSSGGKNEKKRSSGGGSSGTKDFLTSLKRKKKQRQRSVENLDTILNLQPASYLPLYPPPSQPPPPPPPPPPPSSVFHNLFSSKKGKTKKVHSVPPPPPPPPVPNIVLAASKTKSGSKLITASKPPLLPVKTSSGNGGDENVSSGNESPLVPIPPPPPPPPFKMQELKFVVHGDFVRIKSNTSSRSGSPDLDDDGEGGSSSGAVGTYSGDSTPTRMFCPSPDVDTKADSFIARFRAGLKLEKMNSIKEKQGKGRSNLGPEPRPQGADPS